MERWDFVCYSRGGGARHGENRRRGAQGEDAADWEAAVERILEQMEQADARIREFQAEIDYLRAETRTILAQMRSQLPGEA